MEELTRAAWKRLVPAFVAAGIIGGGVHAAAPSAAASAPACRIEVTSRAGGVGLEALVRAGTDVGGTYRFTASSVGGGGSSRIDQSGELVGTGAWSSVGEIELGGRGVYEARLRIESGGQSFECRRRTGGRI